MSGSFPTSPAASSVSITSLEPTLVSISQNLKRQVRKRGGQRWQLEVEFPPMTRSEFAPIYAFAIKQKGQFETFTYVPPVVSTSQGDTTESPVVDGALTVGASSATIDGLTASESGIIKAGDFFKFSGHSKIYMATADMDADGTGHGTLSFAPDLLNAVANDETITFAAVPFTVAFTQNLTQFNTDTTALYGFSMSLIEVF
jgi:hypothetical protein|tara:strand:+ start:4305 stop:4907 length:603 start_codon:yes stop_codon:yes gene_type:complete